MKQVVVDMLTNTLIGRLEDGETVLVIPTKDNLHICSGDSLVEAISKAVDAGVADGTEGVLNADRFFVDEGASCN